MTKLILPDPKHYTKPLKVFIKRDDNVPGWVYLLQDPRGNVKIGLSRQHKERQKRLQQQYGEKLKPLAVVRVHRMKDFENLMLAKYKAINYHKPDHLSGYTEWHKAGYFKGIEMILSLYLESVRFNFLHSSRFSSAAIYIGLFLLSAFVVLVLG